MVSLEHRDFGHMGTRGCVSEHNPSLYIGLSKFRGQVVEYPTSYPTMPTFLLSIPVENDQKVWD
jgi:hypothetical protein